MRVKLQPASCLSCALIAVFSGCASHPVSQNGVIINDPYESVNRQTHDFNKELDENLIGPISSFAKRDDDSAPSDGLGFSGLIINAGSNLSLPGKVVNGVLQGRFDEAGQNLLRFAVNTTIGLGGFLDPAGQEMGLTEIDTDFGETMAVWGVPEGAYVELPVLGPSTRRDATGKVVDLVIDPLRLTLNTPVWLGTIGLRSASKLGDRARFSDTVDSVMQDSADSYAQARLIYLQHRRHDVGEQAEAIDPYAEFESDDNFIDPYAEP